MKEGQIESVLEQYVMILKQGGQENLAWLVEELVSNPELLEHDDPAALGAFQVEGRQITEEFISGLVLGILQTQERNTNRNPSYKPTITAPLGYYSLNELYDSVDEPLIQALRDLEEYGDSGEGVSSSTADERLYSNIMEKGYSDKTARLMSLAYAVGGMAEYLESK